MHDVCLLLLRLGDHRPELVDPERRAVRASSHLTEEHGPARPELDAERNGGEQRREEQQPERRGHEVECPLEDPRRAREPHRPEPDERDAFERVHLGTASEDLEVPRDDVDLHVEIADRADVREHGLVRVVREGEDHALDAVLDDAFAETVRATEEEGEPLRELVVELGRAIVDEARRG